MADNETFVFAQGSIAEIADAFPQAVAVFEDAGIDYSCKGARSLADAASAAGYRADELIELIQAAPRPADAVQWSQRALDELARFLAADHADTGSRKVPDIRVFVEGMADRHPSLINIRRIAALLSTFSNLVTVHMAHEERDLFASLAVNGRKTASLTNARLSQRVLRELVEHETFREHLRTMRELCLLIEDNCASEIYSELDKLSRAVHFHMHLENNILYPRAIDSENQLRRAS
jgi:regulator of cell morphogenesis and NO signaling